MNLTEQELQYIQNDIAVTNEVIVNVANMHPVNPILVKGFRKRIGVDEIEDIPMINKVGVIRFQGYMIDVFGTLEKPVFRLNNMIHATNHIIPGWRTIIESDITSETIISDDDIGESGYIIDLFISEDVVNRILETHPIEQQAFRSGMSFLRHVQIINDYGNTTQETLDAFSEALRKLGEKISASMGVSSRFFKEAIKEAENAETEATRSRLE